MYYISSPRLSRYVCLSSFFFFLTRRPIHQGQRPGATRRLQAKFFRGKYYREYA